MKFNSWKVVVLIIIFIAVAYALFPRGRRLAEMYMASFQWEEAFQILEAELLKHPDDPRLLKDLALYAESQGASEKELKLYERLVELRPHHVGYRQRLAQLYRWSNRVKDELAQLEEMARLAPNNVETHERLADFYHWYKKLDKAVPHHQELIKLKPKETSYYHDLADTYMHLGEYEKGIAIYEDLVRKNKKDPEFRFILADAYEWKEHLDKALEQYLAYVDLRSPEIYKSKKMNDTDIQVFDHVGQIKIEQKKFDEAEQWYENLEKNSPDKISWPNKIYWQEKKAAFYVQIDQLDKAHTAYMLLAQQFPKNKDYQFELAQIYIWKHELKEALKTYQQIKEEDPNNKRAWEGIAQTALWSNRHGEAVTAYQYLSRLEPHNDSYKRQLGFLYFWQGDSEQAKTYLEAYVSRHLKDKEVQVALVSLKVPQLVSQKDYFKASYSLRALQDLSDPSLEWFRKEIKKQTAWKVFTEYKYIETVDKKSRQGEFTHHSETKASKYLVNRFQMAGRYRWLSVKDTALAPAIREDISTVGMGIKYDVTHNINISIEPQAYMGGLFSTMGTVGEITWDMAKGLYVDMTGRFHELWTSPLDAIRYKGTKSGGDLYGEYRPEYFLDNRFTLITGTGWNAYFTDRGKGKAHVGTGAVKTLFAFFKKPKIEIGYFLDYQHAVQNELLVAHSPLVGRILSHYIVSQLDYSPWSKFRLFMSGAIGEDRERKLYVKDTALWNYFFKGEWKASDRLFLSATYAYSSESSLVSKGVQSVAIAELNYSFH
ncbi:MAG: hypothetical protein A2Z91_05915 [Deltaproteobacteria bacterium GWA2_38_16]|nr:MAG: hypothetical protein A2Z91_05915 [Deltaproteobacteria bacterium GWA2_38_16]OGQ02648.1 MAG: hypothetical protein A3D19_05210 [Deltaproteobacteria bacterium RIFCSPHIGHO2_02_FULL_38_15]HBQ21339.1 hypothetical protein [Deltaproteobacteria bacterium]